MRQYIMYLSLARDGSTGGCGGGGGGGGEHHPNWGPDPSWGVLGGGNFYKNV